MGAKSLAKGKSGERELRAVLEPALGLEISRNLVQAREGGADLVGIPGIALEVKRHRRATRSLVEAWWGQAVSQAALAGGEPALAWRQDRDEWRVVVHHMFPERFARGEPPNAVCGLYERTLEVSLEMFVTWVRDGLQAREHGATLGPECEVRLNPE